LARWLRALALHLFIGARNAIDIFKQLGLLTRTVVLEVMAFLLDLLINVLKRDIPLADGLALGCVVDERPAAAFFAASSAVCRRVSQVLVVTSYDRSFL